MRFYDFHGIDLLRRRPIISLKNSYPQNRKGYKRERFIFVHVFSSFLSLTRRSSSSILLLLLQVSHSQQVCYSFFNFPFFANHPFLVNSFQMQLQLSTLALALPLGAAIVAAAPLPISEASYRAECSAHTVFLSQSASV